MPTFAYKAIDPNGKEVAATLNASSRTAVLDELTKHNLCPVFVESKTEKDDFGFSIHHSSLQ